MIWRRLASALLKVILFLAVVALLAASAWRMGWRISIFRDSGAAPRVQQPVRAAYSDEQALQEQMPSRDVTSLANGLQGPVVFPAPTRRPQPQQALDASRTFWVSDANAAAYRQITATLVVQTDHCQMWVEEGINLPKADLEHAANAFETHTYPTLTHYFGAWPLEQENGSRLVVLNARFEGAAGYFTAVNEYASTIYAHSNESDMVLLNTDALAPNDPEYDAVLAHEFQHLIHWHYDPSEETWVTEGCSMLAEELVGYSTDTAIRAFERQSNVQLNTWSDDADTTLAHYGASYLMMHYYLQTLDADALRALVANPEHGLEGIESTLATRSDAPSADALYGRWLVANLVGTRAWISNTTTYDGISVRLSPKIIRQLPYQSLVVTPQYAAEYVKVAVTGAPYIHVALSSSRQVKLVDNTPTSGSWQWWSNRGDGGHAYLQRTLDLTHVSTATLSMNLWYDIEESWDYAYVRASTDEGKTWTLLQGEQMRAPSGEDNALGPGYTGKSGGGDVATWVRESLDLSPFCGHKTLIRLDYLTDEALNRPGLCVDDVSVAAIGFKDDCESGEGQWQTEGFLRINNRLQQRYIVWLAETTPSGINLSPLASARGEAKLDWYVKLQADTSAVALIVSPVAPVTTEPAVYQLLLEQTAKLGNEQMVLMGQDGAQVEHNAIIDDAPYDRHLTVAQRLGQSRRVFAR